jgi:hypothetical protein
MPGKYTAYRGKFPESPRAEWWAKIDAATAEYLKMGINNFETVGQYIQDVSKAKDEMEEEAKQLGYQLAALERIMLDLLDNDKLDSVSLSSGNFSRQDKLNVHMEDRGAFYAWLKANGMEDLFSVNANTAAMIVKEAVLADKELPPGTSVSVASVLQRRKTKGE